MSRQASTRSELRSSLPRRLAAGAAALALAAGGMAAVAGPAAAAAVAVCGADVQNSLQVTPTHDTALYVDINNGFDASYLGYKVTNSGSARTNLWVQVGSFSGGVVSLADSSDDRQQIPTLGAGASGSTFFLVKATGATSVDQGHVVTVTDRRPDLAGAVTLLTCSFTFTDVSTTIQAAANKVTGIVATPAAPAIGQTVTVTVDGQTGQATGAMWVSPAALSTWPSKALRLETTKIEVNTDGVGGFEQTYNDTLIIPSNIASAYTSSTTYRATYTFRLTRPTASNPSVKPVAQIYSGGAFKHTGSYPTLPTIATSSAATAVTVTKTMPAADTSTLPTTTSPNGVAGATTYVEVPFRVTATTVGGNSVVDEIVDVPASGVIFKNGSARLTDATPLTSAVIADPVTSPSDTGVRAGARHFTGPFYASVAVPVTIDYVMYVPITAGTYSNQAFATINGTVIGSTATTVPIVNITTNGTGVSAATAGSTGAGVTSQTITFTQPSGMTLPSGTQSLTASASSGLAVTLTSTTTDVCTVSGTTVTSVSAGTCSITATQIGDASYSAAAPVTRTFTVSRRAQTITFAQPTSMTLPSGTQALTASASSGLAVTITSSTPDVCTVAGSTVTSHADGTCTLTAAQPGDGTYLAAASVERSFTVSKAAQTVLFAQPDAMVMTSPTQEIAPTATSGLPVTITSLTPDVCTVEGTTVTAISAGDCTISAAQPGDADHAAATSVLRTFTVSRVAQTITFVAPDGMTLGGLDQTLDVFADSGLAVALASTDTAVCTVSDGVVTAVGGGTCELTATQPGDATYLAAAPVVRSFTVVVPGSEPQTITFAQPDDALMTDSPLTVAPTASSRLDVQVTSSDETVCTVHGFVVTLVGAGTCTLVAHQDGDAVYAPAADVTRSFTVAQVEQVITFVRHADVLMTASPLTVSASSSSGLAVDLASSDTAVCTVSGRTVTLVGAGTCTLVASQPGDASYAAAPDVERSFLVERAPQEITFVQPSDALMADGSVELDASASSGLAPTVSSTTPDVCTVDGLVVTFVAAGSCTLVAVEEGSTVWLPATDVERTFVIARATQSLTFVQPDDVLMTGTGSASASSDAGLDVVLTSETPAVCTVAAGVVTPVAAGECTLIASQEGSALYEPADDVRRTLTIARAPQTASLVVPLGATLDESPIAVETSATSGLDVTLASTSEDVCTVGVDGVALVATGTCTLVASQPGDGTWLPADDVERSFLVRSLGQAITFGPLDDVAVDAAAIVLDATSDSLLPVRYESVTPDVCTVADDGEGRWAVTLVDPGTCTLRALQDGDALFAPADPVEASFDVSTLPSTIAADQPADALMPAATVDVAATLDRAGPLGIASQTPDVCDAVEGLTIALLAPGTCTVELTAEADGWYLAAAPVALSFEVSLAPQSLDLASLDDTVVDDGPVAYEVTSSREPAPTPESSTPSVCTVGDGVVLLVAPGTCTLSVSDDGAGLYEPAGPVVRSFEVLASLVITAPEMPAPHPGDPVSFDVPASGGIGDYTFEVTEGSLPDGLALDPATGAVTGTPSVPGTYVFTVTVTDAEGHVRSTELTLVVSADAPLLPDVPDGTVRMAAGTTFTAELPGLPGAGTWQVVASSSTFTRAAVVDGSLRLTASAHGSGVQRVVVVAHVGPAAAAGTWRITVVPQAPAGGTYRLVAGLRTTIAWTHTVNTSARSYRVYVDGALVARTNARTVTLARALGPTAVVTVRAVGSGSVLSAVRRLTYRAPANVALAAIGLDVYFATDSSVLNRAARRDLSEVARIARSQGFTRLRVVGHTDDRASYAYNLWLSRRRADAVQAWLRTRVPGITLTAVAMSETKPVDSNVTAHGRAHNRRVDIQLW